MIRPPFGTPNRTGGGRCRHCNDEGVVSLDAKRPGSVRISPPGEPGQPWLVEASWTGPTASQRHTAVVRREREIDARRVAAELEQQTGPEYGAPCPMCEWGAVVNENSARTLKGRALYGGLTFWQVHDVTTATWEHGLSIAHDRVCRMEGRCQTPAAGAYCDYHSRPENRASSTPPPLPEHLHGLRGYTPMPGLDEHEQDAADAVKGLPRVDPDEEALHAS